MKYVLLIYTDNDLWQREVGEQGSADEMEAYGAYSGFLAESGAMRGGDPLQPTTTASTVRIRSGQQVVTDGPFAETRETLGGYYIVEARDQQHAVELAAKCPGAKTGSVEVRPVMELPPEYQEQMQQAAGSQR